MEDFYYQLLQKLQVNIIETLIYCECKWPNGPDDLFGFAAAFWLILLCCPILIWQFLGGKDVIIDDQPRNNENLVSFGIPWPDTNPNQVITITEIDLWETERLRISLYGYGRSIIDYSYLDYVNKKSKKINWQKDGF